MSSRERVQIRSRTSRGCRPDAERVATPVAIRRFRPATRTMKNSSRLLAKIARKLARSSSGRGRVLGEFQNPLVEREPAALPVQETALRQLIPSCAVVLVRVEVGVEVGLQVGDVRPRRCAGGARLWSPRRAAGAARVPGRLAGSWTHSSAPKARPARRRGRDQRADAEIPVPLGWRTLTPRDGEDSFSGGGEGSGTAGCIP